MKQSNMKVIALVVAYVLMFTVMLTGCSSSNAITIGSKDFSENIVLGEIFAQLIEAKTDLKVNRNQIWVGPSLILKQSKMAKLTYIQYTCTALTAQLKMDVIIDSDEAYRVVSEEFDKQFNIKWLEPSV